MIPTGNRVLLKHLSRARDELWLPDDSGVLQRGVVVKAGADCRFVEEDDVVLFKTDESLRVLVPARAAVPDLAESIREQVPDYPPLPGVASSGDEEALFIVPEPGVYLILERG